MRTPEQVRWDFVQDWLRRAEDDRRAARTLLAQEFNDYGVSAFHAQQCAEKAIKAYLVRWQIEFPKTHDMERLRRIMATADEQLAQDLFVADALSPYSVEFRYPGEFEPVSKESAEEAIAVAEKAHQIILQNLEDYLKAGRPEAL
ncbi:MAG: HEPN domain-containing protein [Candidatus Hydrogenedentota bacterium]